MDQIVITHLSDVTNHDAHIVYYMTKDCIETLKTMHPEIEWTKFYIWSDGCAAQYKGKHSFYYLDKFPVEVERNFFGSEHGKSESDAVTGRISQKLSNAIRTRNYVFNNASDMHTFFSNDSKDEIHKYKLVTDSDLGTIYKDFDGVKVETLSGNCTRSLHQIKASKNKNILMTRPFSCFCNYCLTGKSEQCQNRNLTLGKFTDHKLLLNVANTKYSSMHFDDENEERDEDNQMDYSEDDLFDETENLEKDFVIEQQELQLQDLSVTNFVIVSLLDVHDEIHKFVAKITRIKNEDITINYLKQDFDHPDVFTDSDSEREKDYIIQINDIVMLLPMPAIPRRGGRYFFNSKIRLNK